MKTSKQIRNLGLFLMACYMALFVQLNRWTVFDARELQENPNNNREAERDFSAPRGSITTADGVVLARSVDSDDRWERQRQYPTNDLFGHITGYFSPLWVGTAGLEREYNDQLAGRDLEVNLDTVDDLFTEQDRVGNLILSMRNDVQTVAQQALAGQRGSVIVMDPQTGGIIAMYSNPGYDPNTLSTHDQQAAVAAAEALAAQGRNDPRLATTYQNRFPPGSTFKVVTATGGLESGQVSPQQPNYEQRSEYTAPGVQGSPIRNFDGDTCGGTLFGILAESCNTAFAQMGVENVGTEGMLTQAEAFGFNQDVPIDLPPPSGRETQVESVFPALTNADQLLAQSSIGQYEVAATPLQMALVASGVANGGEIMEPHVVSQIIDNDGEQISEHDPEVWTRAMSAETAGVMRQAMEGVVDDGTAELLDEGLPGDIAVGGKTGTAQTGQGSHAWIIGFAGPENGEPTLAVAVMLESVPGVNDDQTGGRRAAPIANAVLQQALQPPPAAQGQTSEDDQQEGQQQGG